ncbi:MAG: hypothetical protein MI741_21205, partial [Rhodospirillales bacterium]|nr:hypothetical protein [Rhodospirillales bacterium]
MSKPFDGKCPPHLAPLLSKLLDDSLSDEQRAELQSILRQDRDCRRYYLRFMQTHAMMQWSFGQITAKSANVTRAAESRPDDEQDIDQFLDVLAGLEESAGPIEPVDITKHLLREEAERKAREAEEAARRAAAYKAQARRLGLSKDGVQVHKRLVIPTPIFYGGIAATIALLLVIGYSTFQQIAPKSIPSPPIATTPTDRPVVATLVRTLDAVWAEHHVQVKPGEKHEAAPLTGGVKLREGDTYTLQQGFAQLDTNSGAIVVLEAP